MAAVARGPSGPSDAASTPSSRRPPSTASVRLLEVGELDAARREAARAGSSPTAWIPRCSGRSRGSTTAPGRPTRLTRSRAAASSTFAPTGPRAGGGAVAGRLSPPVVDRVTAESAAASIPAPLTWAIMREESAFNPDAKSGAERLRPDAAPRRLRDARWPRGTSFVVDEDSLRRPEVSIALGARMLASMRASFPGNPSLAMAAYNCGSAPVRRWLGERGGDDFDVFVERIPLRGDAQLHQAGADERGGLRHLYAPEALPELLRPTRAGLGTAGGPGAPRPRAPRARAASSNAGGR